ncbi:hypothetical protein [Streptomyces sp. NBC_00847]|uniref:hypothetical protein n=1 Tax=unclassified Streptomyces TaxID=2593676 RepID=UPI0022537AB1|nr:hypothetical protein [Streptomyces sp. NBC_00847]MCX4884150.1 hypothetical protein [Streptomyces sp. NBC_00847]
MPGSPRGGGPCTQTRSSQVQRSYSFARLDCGHGWEDTEDTYDLDVTVDDQARR